MDINIPEGGAKELTWIHFDGNNEEPILFLECTLIDATLKDYWILLDRGVDQTNTVRN